LNRKQLRELVFEIVLDGFYLLKKDALTEGAKYLFITLCYSLDERITLEADEIAQKLRRTMKSHYTCSVVKNKN